MGGASYNQSGYIDKTGEIRLYDRNNYVSYWGFCVSYPIQHSVSHTGFTCLKGSIESGTYCAYTRIGHLICVFMNDMPSLGTKGVLPEGYRPPTDIIGFGYVRGTNTSGQILVNSAGEVSTWCNQNNSHYFSGSVCFVVEQHSVSKIINKDAGYIEFSRVSKIVTMTSYNVPVRLNGSCDTQKL